MKKTLITLLLIGSVIGCKNANNQQGTENSVEETSVIQSSENITDSIQVKTIQVGSEGEEIKNRFHGSYPNTVYDFINKEEEKFIQTYYDEFKEVSKNHGEDAVSRVSFGQHFEVVEQSNRFLGFLIERYTSYGNNYDVQYFTHIYDLESKQLIKFSDLFSSENEFKNVVKLIRNKTEVVLKDQLKTMDLIEDDRKAMWSNMQEQIEEGTAADEKNYHAFSWDDSGNLTIYFDKYQVASGNFGNIEVTLTPEEYKNFVLNKYQELFHIKIEEAVTSEEDDLTQTTPIESEVDCGEVPCVALTFDDGPSVYTNQLLDILKENDAKATFFVLGKSAKVQKNTLLRTFQEGHQIGNHSWEHKDLKKLSKADIETQINETNQTIKSITGKAPNVLRPPYGSFNNLVKEVANMPIILWNLDPLDWKDRDATLVAQRMSEAQPNGIVLAHDIHKSTVEAMPKVISALKKKGYHLVTIDELFAGKSLNSGQTYNKRK
ncbi:polysaccharide deacetylase family protein [Weeksellaceae bacterium KMM 9713]|uniref:Polysaccharide deacetylase family protein n=1 Tax=Profundicola chukchiensis TaxID=2961959 RepID=A0A9X4MVQ3_9FLAO|nr:polysaccharide deacetylase family protein [Profundicola chukchiensis]MDG4944943.1 polysaccharide deacetylase family protein [Profundicola chukchiensis]